MGPPMITTPATSLKSGRSGFFFFAMFNVCVASSRSSRFSKIRPGFSHGTCCKINTCGCVMIPL